MSTVTSQQPLKEDEEEEDEEQGEEFVFEDSSDEEKLQEESQSTGSDPTRSVQMSKNMESETSQSLSQTVTDRAQLVKTSPPAGQEGVPAKDVATIPRAGNKFFLTGTVSMLGFHWQSSGSVQVIHLCSGLCKIGTFLKCTVKY